MCGKISKSAATHQEIFRNRSSEIEENWNFQKRTRYWETQLELEHLEEVLNIVGKPTVELLHWSLLYSSLECAM